MEKECYRCHKTKSVDAFYRASNMPGGYFNKCKDCYKQDVRENYQRNREHYVAYERRRAQDPGRKRNALDYQRVRRARTPGKNRARNAVRTALRNGTLRRKPCEVCSDAKSQAHHPDYRSPLKVIWLCFQHHREAHGQTVTA